jgi:hypothetical protein
MIGTRRLILVGGASLALHEAALVAGKKKSKNKNKKKGKRRKKGKGAGGDIDHDAVLANLVKQLSYGTRDDKVSIQNLESRLAKGETVVTQCSNQAWLGVRAVQQAGGKARMVGSFVSPYVPGPGDGHVMMEVYSGGQWLCYDPMCKVQALDDNGNPCSLDTWCASQNPGWRRFAADRGEYPAEAHLPRIYASILGTPWIARSESPLKGIFYSQDAQDTKKILATYEWLEKVSLKEWQKAAT